MTRKDRFVLNQTSKKLEELKHKANTTSCTNSRLIYLKDIQYIRKQQSIALELMKELSFDWVVYWPEVRTKTRQKLKKVIKELESVL